MIIKKGNLKKCSCCSNYINYYEEECPFCNLNLNKSNKVVKYVTGKVYLNNWKELFLFIFGSVLFSFLARFISFVLDKTYFLNKIVDDFSYNYYLHSFLVNFISYLSLFILLILIINKDLKQLFKSFKRKQSILGLPFGLVVMLTYVTYSIVISVLIPSYSKSSNESYINTVESFFPIGMFILVVILGPLCEEIVYRVGLYSILRKRNIILAVSVSSLIFALVHVFPTIRLAIYNQNQTSIELLTNDLLNLPTYLIIGVGLGIIYEFFGFAGSLYAHIFNNFISFLFSSKTGLLLISIFSFLY